MKLTEILKIVSKVIFIVSGWTVLFTTIGLILAAISIIFLLPELAATLKQLSAQPVARAGGIGAILAMVFIVLALWPVWLMLGVMGVGIPALYGFMGYRHGVVYALYYLAETQSGFILSYLIERIYRFARKKPEWGEKIKTSGANKFAAEIVPRYLKKLDDMPFLLRVVFRQILKKFHVDEILKKVVEHNALLDGDSEKAQFEAADRSVQLLKKGFPRPGYQWIFFVLGIHGAVFAAFKFFY